MSTVTYNPNDLTTFSQDQIDRFAKAQAAHARRFGGELGRLYKELSKAIKRRDNAAYKAVNAAMRAWTHAEMVRRNQPMTLVFVDD